MAGKLGLVLLLLLALGAAGSWNYHRNWKAEQQEQGNRPLSGYPTAGLEGLAMGYRAEIEALEQVAASARRQTSEAQHRTFLSERVQEFERIQRSSARIRDLNGDLRQREARLREVEQELEYRNRVESDGLQLHLSRLIGT